MGKSEEPKAVRVEEELSSCPRCGGDRGFHVSFLRRDRTLLVFLICPSCGLRFTVGEWFVSTGEPRPYDPKIDSGP